MKKYVCQLDVRCHKGDAQVYTNCIAVLVTNNFELARNTTLDRLKKLHENLFKNISPYLTIANQKVFSWKRSC